MDRGEAVALMESLQGRSGPVQEPSRREVDYGDATEAAEVVLLADLLLRILNCTSVVAPAP